MRIKQFRLNENQQKLVFKWRGLPVWARNLLRPKDPFVAILSRGDVRTLLWEDLCYSAYMFDESIGRKFKNYAGSHLLRKLPEKARRYALTVSFPRECHERKTFLKEELQHFIPTTEDRLHDTMIQDQVENLLDMLDPEDRELVELRWLQELSYPEIAKIKGDLTPEGARWKTNRVMKKLRLRTKTG